MPVACQMGVEVSAARVPTAVLAWDRPALALVHPLTSDFDAFYAAEYRRIVGLVAAVDYRSGVAEELAQDAFAAAYRNWAKICSYDDPSAWIRRVALNRATSSVRRRTRELRALARLSERAKPNSSLTDDDPWLWEAVRALPRRQAQCVALRYLEDRSTCEIASTLQIAEPTVRVHLKAARESLEARLGADLREEDR